jgi:hypothetical protein
MPDVSENASLSFGLFSSLATFVYVDIMIINITSVTRLTLTCLQSELLLYT